MATFMAHRFYPITRNKEVNKMIHQFIKLAYKKASRLVSKSNRMLMAIIKIKIISYLEITCILRVKLML